MAGQMADAMKETGTAKTAMAAHMRIGCREAGIPEYESRIRRMTHQFAAQ